MALDMTAEQKELGKANFLEVTDGLTRRGFMKSMAAAAGVVPVAAATYFGYESIKGKPVKAALIGCGDEGGVLLGEHNPDYIQFVAACDIRPYNKTRILNGDPKVPLRKGFAKVYGADYAKNIGEKHFYTSWEEMLEKEKDLEAVVIALPLHLHAPVAIACMKAGKHVLCEKLMARTITQCKDMIRTAEDPKVDRILTIGHQRHYSMLYAHAVEVMNSGVLGDVKHIRALWHRNFTWPWSPEAGAPELAAGVQQPQIRDGWYQPVFKMDYDALKDSVKKYGYDDVEQLIRWRLNRATGGGLMAELGSHQLDACSIFLGKVHPIAVTGYGGRLFFGPGKNDRDIDDHIFLTFEFPGKNYANDKNDVVVVSYSSISTNGFEAYGECVMGSRGTLVVEAEQSAMLYMERNPTAKGGGAPRSTNVSVTTQASNKPALESSSTWGPAAPTAAAGSSGGGAATAAAGPISRGYKEEMEDFAYCIRRWNDGMSSDRRITRCPGKVAMADAIIAFTANLAMKRKQRIEFQEGWFDPKNFDSVPEKDGELA
ncbi:Gfo/Idh/MocA family protein [Tuwongella immobilis]|uniref:Gfo/Idh/MocA-like oxidoreductase N-terminal domain-containing protein n=1 Tax=Tuwongella immobilis TaxID=692036 RepID=A0A6C2YPA0_9BACT|nr:Gfo/Idh/MocA family oxidoreductase [Tuwongella immobilis]VIP03458.1 oxidoreductase domain protein : Probable NADH-dependent dehydrogenase OS=Planctomyces maris DSM 8797 GN=PM8797T_28399 PE=4 SV=1: GFO_IDH_MocA [Tuwongella immobilis]VTS04288.1 oxidoreductase domain protein : Probable NADH-dependent dehydrogenase OS=Planctomyces maris DSM 8797 GN=PM8797T_28399 PE=4 SV=1: GFO_IDH_MocA [Tuwongella immobilis]